MITNRDKAFKEAVGGFIIAFSELEFGLALLGTLTEEDPRVHRTHLLEYVGFPFEKKVEFVSKYIAGELVELQPTWSKIRNEIGELNRIRRFIAHGFIQYYIPPDEGIKTHIYKKGKINSEILSISKIKKFTDRLHHLNTGKNGVNGTFYIDFKRARFDKWNKSVIDEKKEPYTVDGIILTEWKGSNTH